MGGGGGEEGIGRGGGYEHKSRHILYTRHIVTTDTNSIQNRGHCSFNHQGKITQKV